MRFLKTFPAVRRPHPPRGRARPGGLPLPTMLRQAVCCTRLPAIVRHLRRRQAAIVGYHGVIPDQLWNGWIMSDMVPLSLFRRQLAFFRRNYNVLPLSDLIRGLDPAGPGLPPRSLAITFDDGFRNNATWAAAALADEGLPASFFLTTGFVDGLKGFWWLKLKEVFAAAMGRRAIVPVAPDLMLPTTDARTAHSSYKQALVYLKRLPAGPRDAVIDRLAAACPAAYDPDVAGIFAPISWAEAADLNRRGFEIGAHTVSHPILARETDATIAAEIRQSVERIRAEFNTRDVAFTYPNGQPEDLSPTVQQTIRDAGCYCAITSIRGLNQPGDNPYTLRRLPISGLHSLAAIEIETCHLA